MILRGTCFCSVEYGIGYDASTLASLNAFPFRSPRGHFQDILRRKLLRSPFCFVYLCLQTSLCQGIKNKKMSFDIFLLRNLGWKMGFEPTTLGTTILYSNQLSYIHHQRFVSKSVCKYTHFFRFTKIFGVYFFKLIHHNSRATATRRIKHTDYYPTYL